MILITFVENAFKYGSSADTDCTIRLLIQADEKLFLFQTENAIMNIPKEKGHGIGIANCRKRLELLYPGRYTLQTDEADGIYRVKLEIRIKEE